MAREVKHLVMRFFIFKYTINSQNYIEAYPCHISDQDILNNFPGNDILEHGFIEAISRNQARKIAYMKWIDATGGGFSKLPYRVFI